jgi:hypothetical protein
MLRVALSIYLMLAMLASQCFCCCTGTRLLLRLTDTKGATRPAQPSCCCQRAALQPESAKASKRSSQDPSKSLPCRCRDRQAITAQVIGSNWIGRDVPAKCLLSSPAGASIPLASLDSLLTAILLGSEAHLLFVTAQDILRAFHILRC